MRRAPRKKATIFNHPPSRIPATPAIVDDALIEDVDRHVRQHIGPISFVFHEERSRYVHVDVHVVAPRPDRPHYTLVTSGMSAAPMRLACDHGVELRYAEVAVCLWPGWTPDCAWPVRWLQDMARFPHEYDSWLGFGHSVPNGDPAERIDDTDYTGMVFLPLLSEPVEAASIRRGSAKRVEVLAMWPVYEEEMQYKLSRGVFPLMRRFAKSGVTDIVSPHRPNAA